MPVSMRSLLLLGAIFSTTFAAPIVERDGDSQDDQSLTPPPLPSSGLPAPDGLTLKHITIGVGTQNYTCNAITGTYGSNVAVAKLYDATHYLSKHPDKVSTISHDRLEQYSVHGECGEDGDYKPHLRHVGDHFFAPQPILPNFHLFKFDLYLAAKAVQKVPAPDTNKDIDWVYLTDNGNGDTKGLKAVYRVETAGGKPPATCSGDEQTFVPYAAQYWFYD